MSPQNDTSPARTLLEPLRAELSAAEAEQARVAQLVEAAKGELFAAKAEVKKLRTMMGLYVGKSHSGAATKESLRPLVERILAAGPLPEKKLQTKLEAELRANRLPLTALSLIVGALRKEFAAAGGVWSLNASDKPCQAVGTSLPESVTKKGDAK